jgi:hypothetical protein
MVIYAYILNKFSKYCFIFTALTKPPIAVTRLASKIKKPEVYGTI